jgi:hypothetical protein
MAKLGIDAVLYIDTATMPAGWATPTWAPADFISDLTEKTDWDHAEIVIRRSWVKQGAKTVVDVGVTCKMLREPTNATYMLFVAALRSKQAIDILILDASISVVGAQGIRYIAQVIKGGGSQNTNEALWREIEFVPFPDGDPTHIPQWAVVQTAGTVVLTPITPAGTGSLMGGMGADQLVTAGREPGARREAWEAAAEATLAGAAAPAGAV